jgi:hypothetical protein
LGGRRGRRRVGRLGISDRMNWEEFSDWYKDCEWYNQGGFCGLTHLTCNYDNCPRIKVRER